MSAFLQHFTGILFYLLTASYFVGYLLLRNSIGGVWPGWWMQIGDLPLALAGLIYGGTSFYRTVHHGESTSWGKFVLITVPLLIIFTVLLMLNFWVVLGLPIA